MRVIFFFQQENEVSQRLLQAVSEELPSMEMDVYHSTETLADGLRHVVHQECLLLLLVLKNSDLLELISISHLLNDIPKILILPRREEAMVDTGHHLLPRYMGYTDGDFSDVTSVLHKMISNKNQMEVIA